MILELSTHQAEPDITVFELRGRMTLGNQLTEVEHRIKTELQSACRKMVLDLTRLEFIDSAGLGLLVMCAGMMDHNGGRLCVATANPRILQIFEITHLERVVAVHADSESACESLRTGGTAAAS